MPKGKSGTDSVVLTSKVSVPQVSLFCSDVRSPIVPIVVKFAGDQVLELPSSNRPSYWLEHCSLVLLILQPGTVPSLRYVLLYHLTLSERTVPIQV